MIGTKKCVVCGKLPELRIDSRTGQKVQIFFIAPQTKEQLCEECNKTNDKIASSHGDNRIGELMVTKL